MDAKLVRFVLPPAEEPARRVLQGLLAALGERDRELTLEPFERLDLPTLGRMPEGPAVVVADRPVALPPGAAGLWLLLRWSADPVWQRTPVHLMAVPHPALLETLVRLGLPRSRLVATGLPLATVAPPLPAAAEARRRLGLPTTGRRVIAVAVEGFDPTRFDALLFQLTLLDPPATLVFYAGEDEGLRAALRRRVPALGLDARLLPDPRYLRDLLAVADLGLCSSEGVPSAELIAGGLPVVVLPASRTGSDEETRFLLERGAVRAVLDVRTLAGELDGLLRDEAAREDLRARAGRLLPTDALDATVSLIQRLLAERELLLQPPVEVREPPRPAPDVGPVGPPPVLEDLGSGPPAGASRHGEAERSAAKADPPKAVGEAGKPPLGQRELALAEKTVRGKRGEAESELLRWRRRAGRAGEAGDVELQESAAAEVTRLETQVRELTEELARLAHFRLEAQRGQAPSGDREARFRRLELDADLRTLKKKLDE